MRFNRIVLLAFFLLIAPGAWADALSFSWVDISAASLHPDQGDTGHGGALSLSYALSPQAFMYIDGTQQDFDNVLGRRYDFGVGINTDPAAGYVVYATVGLDNAGVDYVGAPGQHDHGYDAAVGIRALLASDWEVYASARYTKNPAIADHMSGSAGVLYALNPHVSLGAGIRTSSSQTAYLFNLRVYY